MFTKYRQQRKHYAQLCHLRNIYNELNQLGDALLFQDPLNADMDDLRDRWNIVHDNVNEQKLFERPIADMHWIYKVLPLK